MNTKSLLIFTAFLLNANTMAQVIEVKGVGASQAEAKKRALTTLNSRKCIEQNKTLKPVKTAGNFNCVKDEEANGYWVCQGRVQFDCR